MRLLPCSEKHELDFGLSHSYYDSAAERFGKVWSKKSSPPSYILVSDDKKFKILSADQSKCTIIDFKVYCLQSDSWNVPLPLWIYWQRMNDNCVFPVFLSDWLKTCGKKTFLYQSFDQNQMNFYLSQHQNSFDNKHMWFQSKILLREGFPNDVIPLLTLDVSNFFIGPYLYHRKGIPSNLDKFHKFWKVLQSFNRIKYITGNWIYELNEFD